MTDLTQLLGNHPLVTGGAALAVGGYLFAIARSLPEKLAGYIKKRVITSVEVPDREMAFRWVDHWLASHPESHRSRAYVLTTTAGAPGQALCRGDGTWVPARDDQYGLSPAPGVTIVRFRGHRLLVARKRRWFESAPNGSSYSDLFAITCFGAVDVIKALIDEALEPSVASNPGVPVLVGGASGWAHSGYRQPRSLESVILPAGVLEALVADLNGFLDSSEWYRDRGIPWQRGYLFSGIPGAGKTSSVIAIAACIGLRIAVLSLSSSDMDDQAIARAMINLPSRTLLLVEDVDALFKEREASSACKVSFAGFLNAVDGISAVEGRVLVLTTNHPDRLDPALIRAGRVDRRVEFGYATPDQAARMFRSFFRDADVSASQLDWMACQFGEGVPADRLSMAAIQEHLLRHRASPFDAAKAPLLIAIAA